MAEMDSAALVEEELAVRGWDARAAKSSLWTAVKGDAPVSRLLGWFEAFALRAIRGGGPHGSTSELEEVVLGFTGARLAGLWKGIGQRVRSILTQPLFAHAAQLVNEGGDGDVEGGDECGEDLPELDLPFLARLSVLRGVAAIAVAWGCDSERKLPPSFLEVASLLHSAIFLLVGEDGAAARASIMRLCVSLWEAERPGSDELMTQTFPALVFSSLGPEAKDADAKRVFAARKALTLFDLADASAETLVDAVLRCFASPVHLRTRETRRFLEFVLSFPEDEADEEGEEGEEAESFSLMERAHGFVLQQLAVARKKVLDAYGDVYFKAWQQCSDADRAKFEIQCLQDLMRRTLLAAEEGAFVAGRRVLQTALTTPERKKAAGVDAVLLKLWGPLLWRGLDAPSATVRRHAAILLLDAFPMTDESQGREACDAALQRQFDALVKLLRDPAPTVRVVAVQGAARILSVFWEVLPAGAAQQLLGRLFSHAARDASSAQVRAAVPQGLKLVLDNPLSHPTLRKALPKLRHLLHDTSATVRADYIELLQRVQNVRGMRFFHICPIQELLARLVLEGGADGTIRFEEEDDVVAAANAHASSSAKALQSKDEMRVTRGLITLLMPSFFPQDAKAKATDLVARVAKCMQAHPAAGLAFYAGAHVQASVGSVARLVIILRKAVLRAIAATKDGDGEAPDLVMIAQLLMVASEAWRSIAPELLPTSPTKDPWVAARQALHKSWGAAEGEESVIGIAQALLGDSIASLGLGSPPSKIAMASAADEGARDAAQIISARAAIAASLATITGLLAITHVPSDHTSSAEGDGEGEKKKGGKKGGKKKKAAAASEEETAPSCSAASEWGSHAREWLWDVLHACPSDTRDPAFGSVIPAAARALVQLGAADEIVSRAISALVELQAGAGGSSEGAGEHKEGEEGEEGEEGSKSSLPTVALGVLEACLGMKGVKGEMEQVYAACGTRGAVLRGALEGCTKTLIEAGSSAAFPGKDAARDEATKSLLRQGSIPMLVMAVRLAARLGAAAIAGAQGLSALATAVATASSASASPSTSLKGLLPSVLDMLVAEGASVLSVLLGPVGAKAEDEEVPGDGRVGVGAATIARGLYDAMAVATAALGDCVAAGLETNGATRMLRTLSDTSACSVIASIPPSERLLAPGLASTAMELQRSEAIEEGATKKKSRKRRHGAARPEPATPAIPAPALEAVKGPLPADGQVVHSLPLLCAASRLANGLTAVALRAHPPKDCPGDAPAVAIACLGKVLGAKPRTLAPTAWTHASRFDAADDELHAKRMRAVWAAMARRHASKGTMNAFAKYAVPTILDDGVFDDEVEEKGEGEGEEGSVSSFVVASRTELDATLRAFMDPFFRGSAAPMALAKALGASVATVPTGASTPEDIAKWLSGLKLVSATAADGSAAVVDLIRAKVAPVLKATTERKDAPKKVTHAAAALLEQISA